MKILIIALLCYLSQGSTQSSIISHTFRLKPNQDLTKELNKFIKANFIKAASVSTCVGSLLRCKLRFANQPFYTPFEGHFEIVSLVGVISEYGSHIHISIADEKGQMVKIKSKIVRRPSTNG